MSQAKTTNTPEKNVETKKATTPDTTDGSKQKVPSKEHGDKPGK